MILMRKSQSLGHISRTNKAYEVALLGLLSALCIVGRWVCASIPNVSPMTAIVIVATQLYGVSFGLKLVVVSTLVSNMLLGMGIWTVFQIMAWVCIVLIASKVSIKYSRLSIGYAVISGFIFGFVVSFEKLFYGGFELYWCYYLAGLIFDALHALGNLMFYPLIMSIFKRIKI